MYFYNIGYCSYEDSYYAQLAHREKFSRERLKEMVFEVAADLLLKDIFRYSRWDTRLNREDKLVGVRYANFDYVLINAICRELIKRYNFEKVKFEATFYTFGWANIFDKDDWKEDIHDRGELDELYDFMVMKFGKEKIEELKTLCSEKEKKREEEIYRRYKESKGELKKNAKET